MADAQETQSLPHGNDSLQHEGADLVDNADALADQSLAHAVQRLGDRLRRHQPGIVPKHLQLATETMGADAGLHADQARWDIREPGFDLAA
jgi:hypothetical protein